MSYIKLTKDSAQRLVNYLVTRPWAEVNDLLVMLQRASQETEMEECDGDRCVDDKAGSSEPDSESS